MGLLQNNKHKKQVINKDIRLDFTSFILLLYIVTMPFISAFAFTGTISLPLIFAVLLFIQMGFSILLSGKLPEGFIGFDLLIIALLLFLAAFSFVVNGWGNSKSLNHTIAYASTFILFYIAIKFTFFNTADKQWLLKKVLQFITYTSIISAVYANIEFISSNLFNLNLNEYIPRPSEDEKFYEASVVGFIYRARGFAPESGHFTFMMELISPLAVYYMYFSSLCLWRGFIKTGVLLIIFFSFIFAASTASFIIVPVAVLAAVLLYADKVLSYLSVNWRKFLILSAIASFILLVFNYLFSFYALLLLSLSDKVDSGSFDDRQARIDFFDDKYFKLDFIKQLSGVGPAGFNILGFDETKSILSLYYSIPFELGILGLLLVILLFLYFIVCTLKIRTKLGFFLMVSIVCGVIHYYFIANFWYPWFWFIAAFAVFCGKMRIFK